MNEVHTTTSLDGITTFPDHGADRTAAHIYILSEVSAGVDN